MLDEPRDAVLVTTAAGEPHVLAYASTAVDLEVDQGEVTVHLEGQVHPQATGRGLASWLLALAERVGAEALAEWRDAEALVDRVGSEALAGRGGCEPLADRGGSEALAGRVGSEALAEPTLTSPGAAPPSAPWVLRLRTALLDGDDAARAWFTRRGFIAVRHLLELRLDLHAPPPAPRWPPGISVRRFVPGVDDEVLWRTHQAAFADVPTHLPIGRDDYLADRAPADDPELVLLAEHHPDTGDTDRSLHGVRRPRVDEQRARSAGETSAGDASAGDASATDADPARTEADTEVVGIAVCRAGTEVAAEDGWVRDLGVVPNWRRHGIAMALLRTTFAAFRARGLTGVALEVDDVTLEGAVALYRRAGMRVTRRTDVLERVSRPAPVTSG